MNYKVVLGTYFPELYAGHITTNSLLHFNVKGFDTLLDALTAFALDEFKVHEPELWAEWKDKTHLLDVIIEDSDYTEMMYSVCRVRHV